MKLPLDWLKQYISVRLSPQGLAERLTMSGTAVDAIVSKGQTKVFDIEITTNRPDCLSVLGIAREVSTLTGAKVRPPKVRSALRAKARGFSPFAKVKILDRKGCPRYTARFIRNVRVKAAPRFAQEFLDGAGTRPISNVVDATNFVLFETGQPLHAFDYDKIKGRQIIVRRSKKGEKFLGINDVEYTLDNDTLVIADEKRPIAIAGVMGGKRTEVTSTTKNILLESAYFDPLVVRQAARKYKLTTESSYRFERGVFMEEVPRASARACDLIREWAGGEEPYSFMDLNLSRRQPARKLTLRTDRVCRLTGLSLTEGRMTALLKRLGFSVKRPKGGQLAVTVPAFRQDVGQEADLIEEVLRIEGFEKVPDRLPVTRHDRGPGHEERPRSLLRLKQHLAALGFHEVITYSLNSGAAINQSGLSLAPAGRIRNPLSSEQEFLRSSFLPGMLQTIVFNVYRKATSLKLFEIGNRLASGQEETVLAAALYGNFEENWLRKGNATFFDLKGALGNALDFLGIEGAEWEEASAKAPYAAAASLKVKGRTVGELGSLHETVLKTWDIPNPVYFAEVRLDSVLSRAARGRHFRVRPVPKFPWVRRDIAFIIDGKVSVQSLEKSILESAQPYIQEAKLFDEYKGKGIPKGKRSLAFSLAYQKETGTFTEEEINELQTKVGDSLVNAYHVEFRK